MTKRKVSQSQVAASGRDETARIFNEDIPNLKERFVDERIVVSRSTIPFSGIPLPCNIENDDQLKEFEDAMNFERSVILAPVYNPTLTPSLSTVCVFGVRVKVVRIIDLPDGQKNAFLVCEERVRIHPTIQVSESVFIGAVKRASDKLPAAHKERFEMLMQLVTDAYEYVKNYFQEISNVQMAAPKELKEDLKTYVNFIIVTSPVPYEEKVKLLQTADLSERAELLLSELEKIKQQIELKKEIYSKSAIELDREQREHFLRTQLRTIQNEIGEGEEDDITSLKERAAAMDWPGEISKAFNRELSKLRRFNPSSPEYGTAFTYLETLLSLPWNKVDRKEIDVNKLKEDLEKDHYGLEKIKERIVEHVAVLKLRGDMRSPILCLYGPPGVGKTSLCKSIAESLKREYARISLGGLHDETEIRGHRRTYVGALPGRIITALTKMDSNNPVFVLDEVDKIGNDHRGDPAQALLEVLDPEQNCKFHDNYLDVDYDLSKIFFIATANDLSTISAPLLDRMELINIAGYLLEEKVEIAKRHLIPKELENHGFGKNEIKFTDDAIVSMIENYTRESGVRKLEKVIARVLRKIAVLKASGQKYPKTVNLSKLSGFLGKEDILPTVYEADLPVGVVPGLAWTPVGGEILYFESSLSKGKGAITLTGNMGDIMKESATIALQWVKANAENIGIDPERFATTDVHLHVPEGAVPKDGPSAGITMVTSIVSSFTGRRMKEKIAMTGEATLRGKVLPVGGIKEKIIGAKRAGITTIILSEKNKKDIQEIEPRYIDGLNFIYVKTLLDVLTSALQ